MMHPRQVWSRARRAFIHGRQTSRRADPRSCADQFYRAMNLPMNRRSEMLIVEAPEDCGNAPRKRVIRDFIVALYSGQTPEVLGYLSENVNWKMIGSWDASDKTGVGHYLSQYTKIVHLRIGTIITHGTDCGIDGEITFESGQQAAFCHVLIFTGGARTAKIKAVRSYQIVSANQSGLIISNVAGGQRDDTRRCNVAPDL